VLRVIEELELPSREDVSVPHMGKWFVAMKYMRVGMTGLLTNDGRGVLNTMKGADHSEFYFDSEVQAHSVASLYYLDHGNVYPYLYEWNEALKAEFNNAVPAGAGTAVQSEVMDFI